MIHNINTISFAALSQQIGGIREKRSKIGKIGPTYEIPNKTSKNEPYDIPRLQPKIAPRRPRKAKNEVENFTKRTLCSKFLSLNSQNSDKYSQHRANHRVSLRI